MSNMVLDGVEPRSRVTDPVTSVDAGREADLAASQLAVLRILDEGGELADFEIENAATWAVLQDATARVFSPQRLRSARAELVRTGQVAWTGRYSTTASGYKTRVWQVIRE